MLLYHGSNVAVEAPSLKHSRNNLDFGRGFYLTSDFDQAAKWARRATKLRAAGAPLVSVYEGDADAWEHLSVQTFALPDAQWLRYVASNRLGTAPLTDLDLVIGPVANDQTIRTVNDYIRGRFTEEIAIQLLLPQILKDQYAFKTDNALESISFSRAVDA